MTYFLINPKFPNDFVKKLSRYGECIPVCAFPLLEDPVNAHPDMLAAVVGDKLFIHAEDALLASALGKKKIPFSLSQTPVGAKYPRDIALNFFTVKKYLFANTAHASTEALAQARLLGFETVSVAQGYAKCSTMLLGDALVTADTSIYKAALERDIDALLISAGNIGIEKYDTGFIGGASGTLAESKVAVFGDIWKHADASNILAFAKKHDTEIINLGGGNLFDYGGFVRVNA